MSSDFRVNPARHSALPTNYLGQVHSRPSPNGLSSTASSLAPSIRQQATNFYQNWCDDCCGLLKRLVQRLFPWLFPNQNQEVVIPQGPISAAVLDQRVNKALNYLQQQLRPRVADYPFNPDVEWEPRGIENELIQNSKVVVFLEYNGMKDFCYMQMNGPPSLEALKNAARPKLEALIRHPDNGQAHLAGLSITTHAYSAPGMYMRTIPAYSLNKQSRVVTLKPDNTLSYRPPNAPGGGDAYFNRDTRDDFREFAQDHVSTPQGRQELERFLF